MMLHPHTGLISLVVALASVSLISGLIYFELQDPSPGQLAAVHLQVPELDGGKNCAACHGAPGSAMKDACGACHTEVANQIVKGTGLHGQLPAETRNQCARCHSDHHGASFALTQVRSFALAGIDEIQNYDHAGLAFQLEGVHCELACTECHKQADALTLPIGSHRFLGLGQDCQTCHEDVHRGQLGPDCGACHGQSRPFGEVPLFQHTAAFPLSGSHGGLQCQDCHAPQTEHAVSSLWNLRVSGNTAVARQCGDCHPSNHTTGLIDAVAQQTALPEMRSCEVCHAVEHPTFRLPHAGTPTEIHAAIGFPLDPPHDQVACQQCHPGYGDESISGNAPEQPRMASDCRACHGDPHGGQFVEPGREKSIDCLSCHFATHFVPANFGVVRHAATAFPLRGAHTSLACDQCHPATSAVPHTIDGASVGELRRFRGTATRCSVCHASPHEGQFAADGFGASDCRTCHDEHGFRRSTFTLELHSQTRFPLDGAHVAVSCIQCHAGEGVIASDAAAAAAADRHPAAHRFLGTPTRCDACHLDVHDGAFRRELPEGKQAVMDCSACHTTQGFDLVDAARFDHAQATGFELNGAHRAIIGCSDCHPTRKEPDERGRRFGTAAGRNCQDCHAQPHGDQFGAPAEVRCASCHSEEHSFQQLTFDHGRDSRFALDQVHGKLACNACHRPYRLPDGEVVVRYKPLGTECADCHLVPAQPKARRQQP